MGKVQERVETTRQRYHARRLRAAAVREYADDPDVVFHDVAPEGHDAVHGINTAEEMMHSAEPITD